METSVSRRKGANQYRYFGHGRGVLGGFLGAGNVPSLNLGSSSTVTFIL